MNKVQEKAKALSRNIKIPGRRPNFDFDLNDAPRYWMDNNPFKSTFLGALSCVFPEGERMFMNAVRHHKDQISDETLLEQIKGFVHQEASHGNEHDNFNAYLTKQGYPAKSVDNFQRKERLFLEKHNSPKFLLAITVALEHFTAILSHQILKDDAITKGMDERFVELWRWHAIEETEHKAVAFDVWQECGGGYVYRCLVMLMMTFFFPLRVAMVQVWFLYRDKKLFSPKTWWSGLKFFFGNDPGITRKIFKDYLTFFKPSFHPWEQDNRDFLKEWEKQQSYKLI